MNEQFYLDNFRRFYHRGLKARRKGDFQLARMSLLKASEMLYKMAAVSAGELRSVRKEKAARLLRLAKSIKTTSEALHELPVRALQNGKDEETEQNNPWEVTEKPPVTFEDIIGMDELKVRIKRFIAKYLNPQEVSKWPGARLGDRMILYGPPGTGKTTFAKAIANEIDASFFSVRGSNILDKWVGESQKNVRRLFDAINEKERAVVFLDDIDGILSKRGGSSSVRDGVVSEFLQAMEGFSSPNNSVLFIGATNLPSRLDDAIISRFGGIFYIPLPSNEARLSFLKREFTKFPYGYDDNISINTLAEQMEGQSMRAIADFIYLLNDIGIAKQTPGEDGRITNTDIDTALSELPAPISSRELKPYEKYASQAR